MNFEEIYGMGNDMATKFDAFLNEQLQDPEIKKEHDDLQTERAIIQALIDARLQTVITQKELYKVHFVC